MARAFASILTASVTALSLLLGACQSPKEAPVEYDYTSPVPAGETQGDDWFDGACVIGHSLMEGFEGFAKVKADIHYFTSTGLSAAGALTYKKFDLPGGGTGTLETGLGQRDFTKVYIMLGINEISTSTGSYKTKMEDLIHAVRDLQGQDTPIYLLSLTPTTKKKSDAGPFNKENVVRLNGALLEVAAEEKCYYVDLYTCFADDGGYLPADKSTDGVHLTVGQYKVMADYIKSHTVQ